MQTATRYREQHGLNPDLGHALGQRDRMTHRLLAFGEVDHRAGLHATRLDLAVSDQLDGVGTAAQGVARRARPEPRDHAGDLAGADIERRHQRGALLRHRAGLRRLIAIEAGHASPAFFLVFLSLNSSSRALAASSDNCTVSLSGRRMSTATMSRENSLSSLSSLLRTASALPTSFSGRRISRPSFSRRFQRRSPTKIAALVTARTCG